MRTTWIAGKKWITTSLIILLISAEQLSISGKDSYRAAGERVLDNVVVMLVEPYIGKGQNITMDNFFTVIGKQAWSAP
jgi:hypothetical protein